jgi:hypothetical protein
MQQPQPMEITVRIHPPPLVQLVSHVLKALATPQEGQPNPGGDHSPALVHNGEEEDEEEEAESVPASDHTADPPEALPPHLYVGRLCPREHRHEGMDGSLRAKRNNGCLACEKEYKYGTAAPRQPKPRTPRRRGQRQHAKAQAQALPVRSNGHGPVVQSILPPPAPVVALSNGHRPPLPAHLEETCFLSPITCNDVRHRYRDSAYTLRFKDSEDCCMCVAQFRPSFVGG